MSKMTIDGTVIQIRQMNVAGGSLPDDWSVKLDVDIETLGVSRETLLKLVGGGSSGRVQLQVMLRKLGTIVLARLVGTVVKIDLSDINDVNFLKTPEDKAKEALKAMSTSQREALRAELLKEIAAEEAV